MAPEEKILIEIKQEDHLKHFNRVDGVAEMVWRFCLNILSRS
jgi:hypothetical protein